MTKEKKSAPVNGIYTKDITKSSDMNFSHIDGTPTMIIPPKNYTRTIKKSELRHREKFAPDLEYLAKFDFDPNKMPLYFTFTKKGLNQGYTFERYIHAISRAFNHTGGSGANDLEHKNNKTLPDGTPAKNNQSIECKFVHHWTENVATKEEMEHARKEHAKAKELAKMQGRKIGYLPQFNKPMQNYGNGFEICEGDTVLESFKAYCEDFTQLVIGYGDFTKSIVPEGYKRFYNPFIECRGVLRAWRVNGEVRARFGMRDDEEAARESFARHGVAWE